MGVINVTPDSFSDGAQLQNLEQAVARGLALKKAGASVVDVGGESTRPGAELVGALEEQQRAIPVVEALASAGVTVSIDTIRADTARAAVLAGASFVNDVSGGTYDAQMYETVAELSREHGTKYIIGHWRGVPDLGHSRSDYKNVVAEVCEALKKQAQAAILAGLPANKILLDPGLGFDKNAEQSWQILREIEQLKALGFPVCVGVSRKRMLGEIVFDTTGSAGEFSDRDLPTSTVTALAAREGIELVRVHDVLGSAQALEVVRLWGDQSKAKPQPETQRSDVIKLTGLEVFAHHGVFDFERKNGQRFLIDIEIFTDLVPAISGDALAETVHYGELAEKVVQEVERDPVDLIETLADRVAQVALTFKATNEVRVTVHKPDAPIEAKFDDVSVSITRFS